MKRQLVSVGGLAIVVIFCVYFFPKSWQMVSGESHLYAEGTRIAGVEVGGLTEEKAERLIQDKVNEWLSGQPIKLQTKGKVLVADNSFIVFDLQKTMNDVRESTDNQLIVEVDRKLKATIAEEISNEIERAFNWRKWMEQVDHHASTLASLDQPYYVYDYMKSDESQLHEAISSYSIKVNDELLVDKIKTLEGWEIPAHSTFSLLHAVEEIPVTLSNRELSILATSLYGAVLPTNFSVRERHIHLHLPDYAEVGKEASIVKEEQDDLVLHNPNATAYKVQYIIEGNVLTARLTGYPLQYEHRIQVKELEKIPPRTIIEFTTFLDTGEIKVEREGKSGVKVQVTRTAGLAGEPQVLSIDYYPPVHRVEWHYGSEAESNEESIIKENVSQQEETDEGGKVEEPKAAPSVSQEDDIWEQGHAVK